MKRLIRRIFGVLPVALALVACETSAQGPIAPHQSPGIANLQPQDDDVVTERAADARCDRALACGEIGPKSIFASREACLRVMRRRASRDIHPSLCDRGVDPMRLDRCVAEIVGEGCGDPYGNFAHFGACRQAAICRMH